MGNGKKRMVKRATLAILLGLLVSLSAAKTNVPKNGRFTAWKATTLSGAAEVITIQQPASGGRRIFVAIVNLYCSVACVITWEQNGTAATATALTRTTIGPSGFSPTVTAWSGSDVGAGTTLEVFRLSAAESKSLNMEGVFMQGSSTATNYSLRTDSITGDVEIYIRWREE